MRKSTLKRVFAALALSAVATTSIASVSAFAEEEATEAPTEAASEEATSDEEAPTEEETTEAAPEEETTEEATEAPTEAPAPSAGPQADGSWVNKDGSVISADEIANAAVKPQLSVTQVEVNEKEAPGKVVEISLNVSGADNGYCSTGVHLAYSPDLELVGGANPEYTPGPATQKGLMLTVAPQENAVFVATAGSADIGQSGAIVTFKFKLPANAKAGDKYPISVAYSDGDIFTNMAKDQAMQAYAFTNAKAGGINVVGATATTQGTTAASKPGESPKTGVAGVGVAAAGLVAAVGAAFVLRKKND